MTCYKKVSLDDPQTEEFLRGLGYTNVESCSELSCWRCMFDPMEVYIPVNRRITSHRSWTTFVYDYGFELGKAIGVNRAKVRARNLLDNFLELF